MGVKEKQDEVGEDEEAEIHKCANVSAEPRSYGSSSAMQSFKPPPHPNTIHPPIHPPTHSSVYHMGNLSIHIHVRLFIVGQHHKRAVSGEPLRG